MNSTEVVEALRTHYGTGWKVVEQVGNTTGYGVSRHIDVVAVGLWPSRGHLIDGIEVKASRADWRRELNNPAKADAIATHCHRFWIAAPADVVPVGELAFAAPDFGLLEVQPNGKVKTTRGAEMHEPAALTYGFLAAILRRIPEPTEVIRQQVAAAERARLEVAYDDRVRAEVERRVQRHELLAERVRVFEEVSGISLDPLHRDEWAWLSADGLGRAVRMLAARGYDSPLGRLAAGRRQVEQAMGVLGSVASDLALIEKAVEDGTTAQAGEAAATGSTAGA